MNSLPGPSLSAVIPTFGRNSILVDSVEHMLSLREPADEIVVIDQTAQHDARTEAMLGAWQSEGRIRWLRLTPPSIPKAMNVGLRESRGPLVLFLDDDIRPHEGLVAAHRRAHEVPAVGAVVGMVLQPGEVPVERDESADRMSGLWRDLRFPFNSTAPCDVSNVMAGNLSVKKDVALAAGGFDERFVGVAYRFETEFCRRLLRGGCRVRYEPLGVIDHLRATRGGTRTFGSYLNSPRPEHSVGDYYFALVEGQSGERWRYVVRRFVREVATRYHLTHPWWIPTKLLGELRGLRLARKLVGARKVEARRTGTD